MKIGVFVGWARLSQSPKVRFKRALLRAIDDATEGIQRERTETRHRLHAEFQKILSNEQVTCVYQPVVRLERLRRDRLRAARARARCRASCTGRTCSSRWRATRGACRSSTGSAG